ncbi:MAG: protein PhnA [Oceanicoccus sp.]|jgi:protein PhnA
MDTTQTIAARSNNSCELCSSADDLVVFEVPPSSDGSAEQSIYACKLCSEQINDPASIDPNHWRCLNESMWSQVPAVQVLAWRQLKQLNNESWAQDLLTLLYLEDEVMAWAEAIDSNEQNSLTLDSNGAVLEGGDTVTLIKDLDVKGAGFTAKRGTAVRNIALTDNPEHIEGKVNGTRIVLVSKFLKKSN